MVMVASLLGDQHERAKARRHTKGWPQRPGATLPASNKVLEITAGHSKESYVYLFQVYVWPLHVYF